MTLKLDEQDNTTPSLHNLHSRTKQNMLASVQSRSCCTESCETLGLWSIYTLSIQIKNRFCLMYDVLWCAKCTLISKIGPHSTFKPVKLSIEHIRLMSIFKI